MLNRTHDHYNDSKKSHDFSLSALRVLLLITENRRGGDLDIVRSYTDIMYAFRIKI